MYELLNLRALKISVLYKNHIFQWMGKIFCVEFQRVPLKFHINILPIHWNMWVLFTDENLRAPRFKSSPGQGKKSSEVVHVLIWLQNLIKLKSSWHINNISLSSTSTTQGSTLSFLAGCPKSHFFDWCRNFLVYWFSKLDNQVVNSTCPKDKLGWIWRADDP